MFWKLKWAWFLTIQQILRNLEFWTHELPIDIKDCDDTENEEEEDDDDVNGDDDLSPMLIESEEANYMCWLKPFDFLLQQHENT